MLKWVFASLLLGSWVGPAWSDGAAATPRHRHFVHRTIVKLPRLAPERHVIEKVTPPGSGVLRINNATFLATNPWCARWTAGERVRLVAGDWHARCAGAVFYNVTRRQTCTLICRS
jgi:hypothetical protein